MNVHEELKKDFYMQIVGDEGYIYYLPEKKMVRIKKEVVEKLQQFQEKEEEASEEVIKIINIIKKQMSNICEIDEQENKKKYIGKLELIVSTLCNLNCVYCYANSGTYNCTEEIMSFSVVDSLIEYLEKEKIEIGMVQFFGGEPLIGYKTISYVCHKFEEHHIPVKYYSMVSNFTVLPEEFIEDIVKYDIGITVSIDGPPEITNKQRIGKEKDIDVYNSVRKNIQRLREKGKDIKAIECTCTDLYLKQGYTKDLLRKFLKEEFHVKNIALEDVVLESGENSQREMNVYFQKEQYTVEEGILLGYLFNKKKQNSIFCGAGKNTLAIFPDGAIYPCHLFALKKEVYFLGNIYDSKWREKEAYRNVIEKIGKVKNAYKCSECNARNFCSQCLALMVLDGEKIDCEKRKNEFAESMINYIKNRCIIHIKEKENLLYGKNEFRC